MPPPPPIKPEPLSSEQPTMPLATGGGDGVTVGATAAPRIVAGKPQVPQAPMVIAGYRRVRQLGAGGMGEVHLARHDRLGRQVALKLLRPNVANDAEFSQRFLRESKAMAQVSHPNVVSIHDAGEAEGYLFMAIEFVDGHDLARLLKTRGTIDEPTAITIMIGCCRGLEAIYNAGLVHRDIKPANIFLDRQGAPKIGDLGLARQVDGEDRMTMTGNAWGTPAYMPPEQLRGVADIDITCDVYALGATLYTILTGSEPFAGPTSFVITTRIMTEPAPDPRVANRTVSAAVAAIIRTCLEKDRAKRYPTPADLRVDLERARDGLPLAFAQVVAAPVQAGPPGPPPPGAIAGANIRTPLAAAEPRMPVRSAPGRVGPAFDPLIVKLIAYGACAGVIALVWWSLQGATTRARPPAGTTPTTATGTGASARAVSQPWMAAEDRDSFGAWAQLQVGDAAIRLRHVPAGTFTMGSPVGEAGRQPSETAHEVTLSRGFWISDTEVDGRLWRAVMGRPPPEPTTDRQPAHGLSWHDAMAFTGSLKVTGLQPNQARLPTEAEWEYACRGLSAEAYASGPAPDPREWLAQPGKGVREVAGGAPNRYGLYDMHGNVREWVLDSWDGSSPMPADAATDPKQDFGRLAVLRGGSFDQPAAAARSAARQGRDPQDSAADIGFRFVIEER